MPPLSDITTLPTLFRGVSWDDGWEFDGPAIVYFPIKRYGIGSNSSHIDSLVEDYCISLCCDEKPHRGWSAFELREFKWRHWSPQGFGKRKNAWHVTLRVKWSKDEHGHLKFDIVKRSERWGRPARR